MSQDETSVQVAEIMLDFARRTGLEPRERPRRYLWTDAFAVCNYLELFGRTGDPAYSDLGLRLVEQVHHTLGLHRDDDPRSGWISGLREEEGERHPTWGGLRIGKQLNERQPGERPDERQEWDRDGQYYHYLTKWMHALCRAARVTADPSYLLWAMELARAAHARFVYAPGPGGRKRMYWKMSIDLSRPLVASMGQHDPLEGLVTYCELAWAARDFPEPRLPDLGKEIAELEEICRGINLITDDPLGIGGLLFDAARMAQLMAQGGRRNPELLESVLDSARLGMRSFARGGTLQYPAEYRLAFRELGLSIGLAAAERLPEWIAEIPGLSGRSRLQASVEDLLTYLPLRRTIEQFWMQGRNREAGTWIEHREINMVMLATSLAPDGFLSI